MAKKKIASVIAIITLFASCAKEGPSGPTGPVGPSLSGAIIGHVKLYDMYGSSVTNNLNKVDLYLDGNTVPDTPLVTGSYAFATYGGVALVTGIYSIAATDSGYGATLKNDIQLVAGNLNVDIKLSAIPDSFISSFTTYHNTGSPNDSLVLTFLPDSRLRYCIIFANSAAAVGGQPSYYLYSKVLSIAPSTPLVTYVVPGQDLTDVGMTSGKVVYYAAYSYVVGDASAYEDITTGKTVYNAISGGLADSTVVP